MAVRDKSQNVGFVYTNIYELYKKAQAAKTLSSDTKVIRAEDLVGADVKIAQFQPRQLNKNSVGQAAAVSADAAPKNSNPFEDLRANMHKLQDLHSRLRFMLKELEDLVNKK